MSCFLKKFITISVLRHAMQYFSAKKAPTVTSIHANFYTVFGIQKKDKHLLKQGMFEQHVTPYAPSPVL